MSDSATAVLGHSYGALLAARVATSRPVSAFVSIGGVWPDWLSAGRPLPLGDLGVPAMFMWGSDDPLADLSTLWREVSPPKHKIVFDDATHFDHWRTYPPSTIPCDSNPGSCRLVGRLTADLTAIFLSKYLAPERSVIRGRIADSLRLPARRLTERQHFYAGGHLAGIRQLDSPEHRAGEHTRGRQLPARALKG